jgi:hypothetical protein
MVSHVKTSPAKAKAKPSGTVKKPATTASHPRNHKSASLAPVVVDAGRTSKSSLRHLEEGTGPLVHEISQIVRAVHASVPDPASIVIVYREKRSGSSRSASPFELLPFFRMLPI